MSNLCPICGFDNKKPDCLCSDCYSNYICSNDGLMIEGVGLAEQIIRAIAISDFAGLMLSGLIHRLQYHEDQCERKDSDCPVEYSEYITIRGIRSLLTAHALEVNK